MAAESSDSPWRPPNRRRPPSPADAASPASYKRNRDLPDLSLCHGCSLRWPSSFPLSPLDSQWRVVLLCPPCLSRLHSAAACAYCFADVVPDHRALLECGLCHRRVHLGCVPLQRGYVALSELDPESFVCIDCCALPRFRRDAKPSAPFRVSMEDFVRDAEQEAALARGWAEGKAEAALQASELAKGALDSSVASDSEKSEDMVVNDEELALQLHLAMNGSRRISRNLQPRNSNGLVDSKGVDGGIYGNIDLCTEDKAFFEGTEENSSFDRDSSLGSNNYAMKDTDGVYEETDGVDKLDRCSSLGSDSTENKEQENETSGVDEQSSKLVTREKWRNDNG